MEKFARKHYRVAQKEAAATPHVHMEKFRKHGKRFLLVGFGLLIAVWLEGLLVGYLIGKNRGR
ncbi:MAG: hypothetical protein FWD97_05715 [Defluviitaleaceae bacterium]|nr:hypothetical protein [Defluviitaleaceae bacterium]